MPTLYRFDPMRLFLTALILVLAVPLAAEEGTEENHRWFAVSARYEIAEWVPWQYQADKDQLVRGYQIGNLVGNDFQMIPFRFSGGIKDGIGFEISYATFVMQDWGYRILDLSSGRPQPSTISGRDLHRNEGYAIATLPISGGDHSLTLRGGIQRLETFSGAGNAASSSFVKIPAWGLRAGLKYAFDPQGRFSPWVQSDFFWAKGQRIFRASSADQFRSGPYLTYYWGSAATKGEWFGWDTIFGLSWNITENVSLDIGYHYEIAFFRYVHYYVNALPLENQMDANIYHTWHNDGYDSSGMNTKRDKIRGFNLGLTVRANDL